MASDQGGLTSMSTGLTAAEAKDFHKLFVMGTVGFTAIAAIVHFILYQGKPWGPGVSMQDTSALEPAVKVAGAMFGLVG